MKKLHPIDEALELMYFGWRGMTREADRYLETIGLTRVHHRILYAVARGNLTMSDLLAILDISKQALHRPMMALVKKDYVSVTRHPTQHRFKLLKLTAAGREVERKASERERRVMSRAFEQGGERSFKAWADVMREASRG